MYAIKDTETGLYYKRGVYDWAYDLEDARVYPDYSQARRGIKWAWGDVQEHKEIGGSVRPYEPSGVENVEIVKLKEKTILVEA